MKTVFIGSTRRGFLALEALFKSDCNIVGIISLAQDEHEMDRFEGPIREMAQNRGTPIREARSLRDPALAEWARNEVKAEVAFLVGVRVLLPRMLIDAFPRGCWGIHDSLLPAYRGFAPLNWAIINGENETGITLFQIEDGVDTGNILIQTRIPIGLDETAPQLYAKVNAATTGAILEGHRLLRSGLERPVPQNPANATYTCSRTPSDGLIDWALPSRNIHNLIRGLTFPYPGAFTFLENERLFILSSEIVLNSPCYAGRIPGRVVQIDPSIGVDVLTGDGVLRLYEVSVDGKNRIRASNAIRSIRIRLGVDWITAMDRIMSKGPT